MEILKNFGFNPYLLIAQVINFLIILFVLRRFLYKPMLTLLKNRQNTIQEGLKKAEEGVKALEKAIEKEKEILKKAEKQAKEIIDDAKKESEEISKRSQDYTKKQADKMLKEAKEEISNEMKQTEKQLAVHISRVAADLLEKSMQGVFGEREQEEILEKAIKKLKEKPN